MDWINQSEDTECLARLENKTQIDAASKKLHQDINVLICVPGGTSGKSGGEGGAACQCRICKKLEFDPWIGKIHWRRKWQHTPVFLPGKSGGQRGLEGYGP